MDHREPNCLKNTLFVEGRCNQLLNDGEHHIIVLLNDYERFLSGLKNLINSYVIIKIKLFYDILAKTFKQNFELLDPAVILLCYFGLDNFTKY